MYVTLTYAKIHKSGQNDWENSGSFESTGPIGPTAPKDEQGSEKCIFFFNAKRRRERKGNPNHLSN